MRVIEPVVKSLPPITSVVFFGREEGGRRCPMVLVAAVRDAGDVQCHTEMTVKP